LSDKLYIGLFFYSLHFADALVVECWTCDREVAGSNPARGYCVPKTTQRAIHPGSVNEY